MGGTLSPIVEGFLAGKQAQTDVINRAREWGLRKEQLDQMAKEFEVTSKQAQQHLDLEASMQDLQRKMLQQKIHFDILGAIQSGALVPQAPEGSAPVINQGAAQFIPGQPDLTGMPSATNVQLPPARMATPLPAQGQPATVNIPGRGNITVPTPEMDIQKKVNDAMAMLPVAKATKEMEANIDIDKYAKTFGKDKAEQMQMMLELGQEKLNSAIAIAANRNSTALEVNNAKNDAMLARTQLEVTRGLINAGVPPEVVYGGGGGNMGDTLRNMVQKHGEAGAVGEEDVSKLSPLMKSQTQTFMLNNGLSMAPKEIDKIYEMGSNATRLQNGIENLASILGVPTSVGGKVRNIVSTKLGAEGLSPYKSQYDMFKTSLLPVLDVGVGLTPGTLARSPKLYDKLAGILPLPGDAPSVVSHKQANANDVFLTSIQSKMGSSSEKTRKLIWTKLVNENPDLMNNYETAVQLKRAMETGLYSSGSVLKTLLGGQ